MTRLQAYATRAQPWPHPCVCLCPCPRVAAAQVGTKNAATGSVTQRLAFVGSEAGKLLALRQLLADGGTVPPVLVFVGSQERAKALHRCRPPARPNCACAWWCLPGGSERALSQRAPPPQPSVLACAACLCTRPPPPALAGGRPNPLVPLLRPPLLLRPPPRPQGAAVRRAARGLAHGGAAAGRTQRRGGQLPVGAGRGGAGRGMEGPLWEVPTPCIASP
jgi:hypothetical protein